LYAVSKCKAATQSLMIGDTILTSGMSYAFGRASFSTARVPQRPFKPFDELRPAQARCRPFVTPIPTLRDMLQNTGNHRSPQPRHKITLPVATESAENRLCAFVSWWLQSPPAASLGPSNWGRLNRPLPPAFIDEALCWGRDNG
jgi:hypothetical protein